MMAVAVYILCVMTSTFCATLLLREFLRTRARLLLWSSLSFAAFALNNALVFMDLVMLPSSDCRSSARWRRCWRSFCCSTG